MMGRTKVSSQVEPISTMLLFNCLFEVILFLSDVDVLVLKSRIGFTISANYNESYNVTRRTSHTSIG